MKCYIFCHYGVHLLKVLLFPSTPTGTQRTRLAGPSNPNAIPAALSPCVVGTPHSHFPSHHVLFKASKTSLPDCFLGFLRRPPDTCMQAFPIMPRADRWPPFLGSDGMQAVAPLPPENKALCFQPRLFLLCSLLEANCFFILQIPWDMDHCHWPRSQRDLPGDRSWKGLPQITSACVDTAVAACPLNCIMLPE